MTRVRALRLRFKAWPHPALGDPSVPSHLPWPLPIIDCPLNVSYTAPNSLHCVHTAQPKPYLMVLTASLSRKPPPRAFLIPLHPPIPEMNPSFLKGLHEQAGEWGGGGRGRRHMYQALLSVGKPGALCRGHLWRCPRAGTPQCLPSPPSSAHQSSRSFTGRGPWSQVVEHSLRVSQKKSREARGHARPAAPDPAILSD